MKFLLILGFLLGFGGVLAAAGLAPVAVHERIASQTSVANNGGRLETFVIRLPADRIATTGGSEAGEPIVDPVSRLTPPQELAGTDFLIEQFKLRNIDGDVIGVAARHWTRADGQSASAWSVSIPSRGTLVWSSPDTAPQSLAAAIDAAGVQPGMTLSDPLAVQIVDDQGSSRIIAGTEEFDGAAGLVEEFWEISGIGGNGEIRGTISLNTRVSRSQ